MWVDQLTLSKFEHIKGDVKEAITKVRYNDDGTPSTIEQLGDEIRVLFHDPVKAIAPGQAAVFYEGDDVIGGGWIKSSFKQNG